MAETTHSIRTVSPSMPNWILLLLTVGGPADGMEMGIVQYCRDVRVTKRFRLRRHLSRKRVHPPTLREIPAHGLCNCICRPYRDSSRMCTPGRYSGRVWSPRRSSWFPARDCHPRRSVKSRYFRCRPPHYRAGRGFRGCLQIAANKIKNKH